VRAFPVKLPLSERYWTVVDEDYQVVGVADEYLRHIRLGRSKLNLAVEVLTEHHEYGGLCAGCLAHCRQPNCAGCLWHKPYPCPLAVIAQAALCLPAVPR